MFCFPINSSMQTLTSYTGAVARSTYSTRNTCGVASTSSCFSWTLYLPPTSDLAGNTGSCRAKCFPPISSVTSHTVSRSNRSDPITSPYPCTIWKYRSIISLTPGGKVKILCSVNTLGHTKLCLEPRQQRCNSIKY